MTHTAKYGYTERVSFSMIPQVLELPDLIAVQKDSYEWFLKEGLKEVFDDYKLDSEKKSTLLNEVELNIKDLDTTYKKRLKDYIDSTKMTSNRYKTNNEKIDPQNQTIDETIIAMHSEAKDHQPGIPHRQRTKVRKRKAWLSAGGYSRASAPLCAFQPERLECQKAF